jgi:hypothetical protein
MTRLRVTWRAAAVLWLAHTRRAGRRLVAARSRLVPVALVVLGLGGMLAGGALVGEWCLGLVLIAESAAMVWVGLNTDDGRPVPQVHDLSPLERARRAP